MPLPVYLLRQYRYEWENGSNPSRGFWLKPLQRSSSVEQVPLLKGWGLVKVSLVPWLNLVFVNQLGHKLRLVIIATIQLIYLDPTNWQHFGSAKA